LLGEYTIPSLAGCFTGRTNRPTLLEAFYGFLLPGAATFTSEQIDLLLWAVSSVCRNTRCMGCSLLSGCHSKTMQRSSQRELRKSHGEQHELGLLLWVS